MFNHHRSIDVVIEIVMFSLNASKAWIFIHSGWEKLLCPHVDLLHHLHATFAWTFRSTALKYNLNDIVNGIISQCYWDLSETEHVTLRKTICLECSPLSFSLAIQLVEWEKSIQSKLVACSFSCRIRTLYLRIAIQMMLTT